MSMFRSLLSTTVSSKYQILDHIYCDGDQHVNFTTIIPNNHKLEMKIQQDEYHDDNHLFGANYNGAYSDGSRFFSITTSSNKFYWGRNGSEGNGGSWSSDPLTIVYNDFTDAEVKVNGVTIGSGYEISTQGYFFLFKRSNTTSSAENIHKFIGNFYYCKLWDRHSGILILDVVPAKRLADDVIGLYDLASGTFYENDGSGSFTE